MAKTRPVRILFACVGNSCRSQMAEGFARAWGGPAVEVKSGGSRPAGMVAPKSVLVMREVGIDITAHKSKGIDEAFAREADVVVTMGCGDDACPAFIGREVLDWPIPDPMGRGEDAYRAARDDIGRRVKALLEGLQAPSKTWTPRGG